MCRSAGVKFLVSLVAILFSVVSAAQANNFSVSYLGRTYHENSDTTEFTYELCWDGTPPGLSHFDLGAPACEPGLDVVAGGDPLEGCGAPEDPAIDPSTDPDGPQGPLLGFYGIKWPNCSFGGEECSAQNPCCDTFSVVVDGNHGEQVAEWLAKAGNCDVGECDSGTIGGPSCATGNLPPICDVGGPYNVACGNGTGQVQLDATGSSDPDGSSSSSSSSSGFPAILGDDDDDFPVCSGLTYHWETDCPGGTFDNDSSATPTLTFNTEHAEGVPLSCSATVTVTDCHGDSSSCSATINVGECTFDCTGTLNGDAQFDDCGVCEGDNSDKDQCGVCFGNNETLDECGICDGMNLDKDQCGVCFGDDSTCQDCNGIPNGQAVPDECGVCGGDNSTCENVCQETLITEQLFSLDGLALEYSNFIGKLSKRLAKVSGNKNAGKAERSQAEALYIQNWTLTWSVPEVIVSDCSLGQLCVTISNETTLSAYSANNDLFGQLANGLIKKLNKLGVKTGAATKTKNKLDKQDESIIATIPATTQDCGD